MMAEEEGKGAPAAHPPVSTGAPQAAAPQPEKTQQIPTSKSEGVQGSRQGQQGQAEQTTGGGGGEDVAGSAAGGPQQQGQPAQRLPMTFKIKM